MLKEEYEEEDGLVLIFPKSVITALVENTYCIVTYNVNRNGVLSYMDQGHYETNIMSLQFYVLMRRG